MNKKSYQRPTVSAVTFQYDYYLLVTSDEQTTGRPTASYMSNPDIGEYDDDE